MFKTYFSQSMFLSLVQVVKQRLQTRQFTSAPHAVRMIVSNEGFKGLYAVRNTLPHAPHAIQAFILHCEEVNLKGW